MGVDDRTFQVYTPWHDEVRNAIVAPVLSPNHDLASAPGLR